MALNGGINLLCRGGTEEKLFATFVYELRYCAFKRNVGSIRPDALFLLSSFPPHTHRASLYRCPGERTRSRLRDADQFRQRPTISLAGPLCLRCSFLLRDMFDLTVVT